MSLLSEYLLVVFQYLNPSPTVLNEPFETLASLLNKKADLSPAIDTFARIVFALFLELLARQAYYDIIYIPPPFYLSC